MRHTKLIVLGIVLVAAVVFGSIFWSDFTSFQKELAETPVQVNPSTGDDSRFMDAAAVQQAAVKDMSTRDSYDAMDKDLDNTEVENVDSDSTQLQAEVSAF
jgi:hypothetical protein